MNIIVVPGRLAKPRSLGTLAICLGVIPLLLAMLAGATALGIWWGQQGAPIALPGKPRQDPVSQAMLQDMAVKVGELQAKLTRMDQLLQEVGQKTGLDVKPFLSDQPAAKGGFDLSDPDANPQQLQQELGSTAQRLQANLDALVIMQTMLYQPKASQLPVHSPMRTGLQTSSFGWRIHPIRGGRVFHEGLDYGAPTGTPIEAAADGVVTTAEYHPQYGNMVDLDHGNGLLSRYAHASKLLVAKGERVKVGQQIALVGSTGNSTGPHLHFEIRFRGIAQNPLRFVAPELLTASAVSQN